MAPIHLQPLSHSEKKCEGQRTGDRNLLGDKNQHFHPLTFLLPGGTESAG